MGTRLKLFVSYVDRERPGSARLETIMAEVIAFDTLKV